MTTLDTIYSFIKAKCDTEPLIDMVRYVSEAKKTEIIPCKNFGVMVYNSIPLIEQDFLKIGNIVLETWSLNVDVIIKLAKTYEQLVLDPNGIGYWIDKMRSLFMHQTNSGAFKDCYWLPTGDMDEAGAIRQKGILTVEVERIYNA